MDVSHHQQEPIVRKKTGDAAFRRDMATPATQKQDTVDYDLVSWARLHGLGNMFEAALRDPVQETSHLEPRIWKKQT